MRVLPNRRQWRGWSLPSKLSAIGGYASIIGLVLMIAFRLFPDSSEIVAKPVSSQEIAGTPDIEVPPGETQPSKATISQKGGNIENTTAMKLRPTDHPDEVEPKDRLHFEQEGGTGTAVELHSLWSLKMILGSDPTVYVNYIPNYPDEEIRNIFYSPSLPDMAIEHFGLSNHQAALFFQEVATSPTYASAIGSLPGKPDIHETAIQRRVGDKWLAKDLTPGIVSVILTPMLAGRKLKYREFDLKMSELSGPSQTFVRRLDKGVRKEAHDRYVKTLSELGLDRGFLPPES